MAALMPVTAFPSCLYCTVIGPQSTCTTSLIMTQTQRKSSVRKSRNWKKLSSAVTFFRRHTNKYGRTEDNLGPLLGASTPHMSFDPLGTSRIDINHIDFHSGAEPEIQHDISLSESLFIPRESQDELDNTFAIKRSPQNQQDLLQSTIGAAAATPLPTPTTPLSTNSSLSSSMPVGPRQSALLQRNDPPGRYSLPPIQTRKRRRNTSRLYGMCVCTYVCMYICMYVCIRICLCMHVCT